MHTRSGRDTKQTNRTQENWNSKGMVLSREHECPFFQVISINNSFSPLAYAKNTLCIIRKIRIHYHLLQPDRAQKLRMAFFCLHERNRFALSSAMFMNAKIPHIQSCNPFREIDGLKGSEKNNYPRKKQYNSPINFPLSPALHRR